MIQEPKSGSGSDIPDTRSTCMTKVTGLEKGEWKEKLAAFRSDGCAVMTGTQNGIWGLLQQDPSTQNVQKYWCGAHIVKLAVMKSLEHNDKFHKLQKTL